ncbi:MAG TPA: hypothetical protein DCR39_01960, partial [Nitrospiraceae bacterium]|nr:hypothetical protein [Nitrospiraceae bacterium]
MKNAVGGVGERLALKALWGIIALSILLNINVARASESASIDGYFNSLEDSLFGPAKDTAYLKETHPYVVDRVSHYVDYFTTSGRDVFQQWLNQAGPYVPLIKEIFKEEGIPEDLALLPLIESGFNVHARSPKRATGMWQFMASTGALYGLTINQWVDERKDPIKSTRAAARHLKDLYNTFGTWPLALASYNAGSGKVKRALIKTGSSTFWELGQSRTLKAETRNYIPKLMAALIIAKNPEDFGFTFSEKPDIKYDLIEVPGGIGLHDIGQDAGVSLASLKKINPELKGLITPFNDEYYRLRLPEGTGISFLENYNKTPFYQKRAYKEYKVKKGDSVYHIARKYDTEVS